MHLGKELQRKIQAHLPIHGARISFMARFVMALIVVRGVTLSTVASALNPKVLPESNEKRVKGHVLRCLPNNFDGPLQR